MEQSISFEIIMLLKSLYGLKQNQNNEIKESMNLSVKIWFDNLRLMLVTFIIFINFIIIY